MSDFCISKQTKLMTDNSIVTDELKIYNGYDDTITIAIISSYNKSEVGTSIKLSRKDIEALIKNLQKKI